MRPDVENGSAPLEMGEKSMMLQVLALHVPGLTQILAHVIAEVRGSVNKDINGAELLYSLLNAPWLQSLLKTLLLCIFALEGFQVDHFQYLISCVECVSTTEITETTCVFQALLSAHDTVSLRDYEPDLPPLPKDLPEDEEAMRIVCLVKNNQPLGATIRRDDVTGEIYIARVIHGGLVDRSGLLHAGDRLVEVNGQPVFGLEPEQIIQILVSTHLLSYYMLLYVRAMVDYNPHVDPSIPCADAGMAFRKGDILEIVDQSDTLWWQAVKLPSISACAGLIPSTSLLKRSQKELWWSQPYHPHTCDELIAIDEKCVEAGTFSSGFRRSLHLCRQRRGQAFGTSQFCTLRCPASCYSSLANPYEEVVRYQHHPEHPHRLIALLGPSGVGVNELRRRLIEINPKVYQGAVPHTTRPPKCHEESGREYHFISREQFDTMVCNHRFIEFGELRGHLYGTSVDAIKDVLASGKICVIDIEPYALESVRTAELRAYVIFIKPPSVEQMKRTRMDSHIITNYYTSRPFKDEDFQEIEDAGRDMEQHYCQFFDHAIVNDGLQAACVQLLTAVRRAQDEPQWVPAAWIRPTGQS
uniref:Membrane palmitoylated protein 4 n=1 Tax=Cyprinus carpio TaxID=7962 RepID=A0A8C1K9U2_CYPCA